MRIHPSRPHLFLVLCMGTLILAATLFSGCTQPVSPTPAPVETQQVTPIASPSPTPAPVSAVKTDSSHVIVTFNGGPDRARIIELDATVTDSKGQNSTQHIGDRLGTSPVGEGGTIRFTGSYESTAHIFVSAWYSDGSSRQLLDSDL